MPATAGINSYVSVIEADRYFEDRLGYYDIWDSEDNQDGALVSAAQYLDSLCSWDGTADGSMAFPRDGVDVPQAVKDAQCEIAYQLIINDTGGALGAAGDALSALKAGPVSLSFDTSKSTGSVVQTDLVMSLLAPYGTCITAGSGMVPIYRA